MSNECFWERIVHSEIIDREIFIITSLSILIELVDPCKLLRGGLINSVKKVCHRLIWSQTSFDARCRGLTPGCWLTSRFCLLFLMNCWHLSSSVLKDSGTGRGIEQRKIDSMPCIIWVCRVLLCQDQGGQGGTCPALEQDETWLSQGSVTLHTIRVFWPKLFPWTLEM